jgi:uncharacterized protein YlxW (UPF0749 family)
MNPFVSRINISKGSWELPVSALCLVLGVMISLAWINETNKTERLKALSPSQGSRVFSETGPNTTSSTDTQQEYSKLSFEVGHLRAENTRLQNAMSSQSNETKALNQSLQETKLFAGLTEVEGPGVTVTLRDSQKPVVNESPLDRIIHDTDVLKTVNELWAAGAEAVSVNNHRVAIETSFRCVGPTILVDGARIASPVVIRAIGDPDTLEGGLNLPGGVLDEVRQLDPAMVQMERVHKQHLPAYAGPTQHTLLSVPKDTGK